MYAFGDPIFLGAYYILYVLFALPVCLFYAAIMCIWRAIWRWYLKRHPIYVRNGIEFIHFVQPTHRVDFNWKGKCTYGSVIRRANRFHIRVHIKRQYGFCFALHDSFPMENFRWMEDETKDIYKRLCFSARAFFLPPIGDDMGVLCEETTFDDEPLRYFYFFTTPTWKKLSCCYKFVFRLNMNGLQWVFLCNDKDAWSVIENELREIRAYYISRYDLLTDGRL